MIRARYQKHELQFKRAAGTSRGILTTKETWYLILEQEDRIGIGECGLLRGLSADDREDYTEKLQWVCDHIHLGPEVLWEELVEFPSIQFGVEMAFLSLNSSNPYLLFPSEFTQGKAGIPINGLIWMGDTQFMREQIQAKLEGGSNCIKLKIGALDFEEELRLISNIRKHFSKEEIEIRVDANGGFSIEDASEKIKRLSQYDIHSIEQPIKPRHWQDMAELCRTTPIPIALDEELIGLFDSNQCETMLEQIRPQYLIFKPSFIGGIRGTSQWISRAQNYGAGWWITSALEGNIGLNAIAQWTYTLNNPMPQGLGTGALYTNNIESPLVVEQGLLYYRPDLSWGSISQ